jgi:O-antigen/teichoic acid export membrane protein
MALGLLAGLAMTALTLAAASLIVTPIFGARTALFVRRLSEIEVLSSLARVVVWISLAFIGLSGEALVLGVLAGSATTGALAWISAPPPPPRLHRSAARELLSYGLLLSLASISWIGFSNVDYAIIGARLGALQRGAKRHLAAARRHMAAARRHMAAARMRFSD